jgi:hypothetical protein
MQSYTYTVALCFPPARMPILPYALHFTRVQKMDAFMTGDFGPFSFLSLYFPCFFRSPFPLPLTLGPCAVCTHHEMIADDADRFETARAGIEFLTALFVSMPCA